MAELSSVNKARHAKHCKICLHDKCKEIDAQFIAGIPAATLVHAYNLNLRSLWRHIEVFGLSAKRNRTTLAILDTLIENVNLNTLPCADVKELMTVLTLRAKVAGEISETRKHEGGVTITLEELEKKRAVALEQGLKQFGLILGAPKNRFKKFLDEDKYKIPACELEEMADENK